MELDWKQKNVLVIGAGVNILILISNLFFALWLGRQFSGWLNKIFYNSEKIEKL